MNKLLKAVKEQNLEKIRKRFATNPELKKATRKKKEQLYNSILTDDQIWVRETSHNRVLVTLLRHFDDKEYLVKHHKKIIPDYISEVSEDYYCAGWLIDIEFMLYKASIGKSRKFGFSTLNKDDTKDIKYLYQTTSMWAIYEDDAKVIPLDEFKPKFDAWEKTNN
jgi:hypothetical protein